MLPPCATQCNTPRPFASTAFTLAPASIILCTICKQKNCLNYNSISMHFLFTLSYHKISALSCKHKRSFAMVIGSVDICAFADKQLEQTYITA